MPVEPDPSLSKARRGANRSALEMIRDLTNTEELRKKLANADKWQFLASGIFVVFIIVLLFMYLASLIAPGDESEGSADTQPSVTESPVVQPSVAQADLVAPTEADAADSSDEGPLSGTWSMWWRNANDSDSVAFTLRFNGLDTGTVEVLNDENAFDTSFTFEDDRLSFGFTRMFEPPPNWPADNPGRIWAPTRC